MSAWQASSPHHGPGRDNKVGREEMMGMLAAVEAWTKRDHPGEWKTWLSWLDHIATKVSKIEGVTTSVTEPTKLSNKSPVLHISWDPAKLHVPVNSLVEKSPLCDPRIQLPSCSKNRICLLVLLKNSIVASQLPERLAAAATIVVAFGFLF